MNNGEEIRKASLVEKIEDENKTFLDAIAITVENLISTQEKTFGALEQMVNGGDSLNQAVLKEGEPGTDDRKAPRMGQIEIKLKITEEFKDKMASRLEMAKSQSEAIRELAEQL